MNPASNFAVVCEWGLDFNVLPLHVCANPPVRPHTIHFIITQHHIYTQHTLCTYIYTGANEGRE